MPTIIYPRPASVPFRLPEVSPDINLSGTCSTHEVAPEEGGWGEERLGLAVPDESITQAQIDFTNRYMEYNNDGFLAWMA